MSIIYALVGYQERVLCEHSDQQGNFTQMSSSILKKVQPNSRATFDYEGQYYFHYINESGVTYMMMCEAGYPKEVAFSFLESLKKEFLSSFGNVDFSTVPPRSLNFRDKIQFYIDEYNSQKEKKKDQIGMLKESLIDTKNELLQASDILNERGEKINLIVKKADQLSTDSNTYYTSAKNVKKSLFRRKIIFFMVVGVLGIIVVALILYFLFG